MQVGGLAVRWVLTQHAEPWLLTLQSKRASGHPSSGEPKSQASTRKRSRREAPEETGRPAKRPAVDEPPGGAARERTDEEEIRNEEGRDEGYGGKLMNLEDGGGQQTQPEDVGGQKKVEGQETEHVAGDDEEKTLSPAAAALPAADDE